MREDLRLRGGLSDALDRTILGAVRDGLCRVDRVVRDDLRLVSVGGLSDKTTLAVVREDFRSVDKVVRDDLRLDGRLPEASGRTILGAANEGFGCG